MNRIFQIPFRINRLLTRNQGRLLKIILLILVFITALYTKSYKGEYQFLINNHIGGTLYVLFGTLLISVFFPLMKAHHAVLLAFSITSMLEFIQWLRIPFMVELTRIKTFAYLFGNSFNPVDFLYYALGAVVGWLVLWMVKE
jgi:hypothetical protein